MVLELKEYTMTSLGYKLSYTTLISPNQTCPSPPSLQKTADTPPSLIFLLHFLLLPPPSSSSFFFFTAAQWRPKERRRRPPPHQHQHHTFLPFSLLCLAFCFPFPFPFVGFVFPASPSVFRRETVTDGKVRESLHFSFFFFILLSHSHCFQLLFPLFFVPYIFWRALRRPAAAVPSPFILESRKYFSHSPYPSYDLRLLRV